MGAASAGIFGEKRVGSGVVSYLSVIEVDVEK
jgi:hypothetical protein